MGEAHGQGTWATLLFAMLWLSAASLHAQAEPRPQAYLVIGPHAEAHESLAQAWLAEHHIAALPLAGPLPAPPPTFPASSLAPLSAAEAALVEARVLSAQFAEGDALRVLLAASEALRAHLDVPFAHVFLAELEVQIALVAASLGEPGLRDTALTRAASLDPQRSLQAGEAPPEVLARARDIERARDSAARGRVRLESEPTGADAFVDGAWLGKTPCLLEAAPGLHVLTLRAPGHHAFSSALTLQSGERGPWLVALSATQAELARRELARTDATRTRDEAREQIAQLVPELFAQVWLFERTRSATPSLDVFACTAQGCRPAGTLRLPSERVTVMGPSAPPERSHKPLWKRWPLWAALGLAVAAGATTAVVLGTRDETTRRERVLTIDPGMLPDGP